MKTTKPRILTGIPAAAALAAFCLAAQLASASTVHAIYNSATDVPVTAVGYTASGKTMNFTLNFAPVTGTELRVINNTSLQFIQGTFDNLTNGQAVPLNYGGTTYNFVANYYGGTGNDLVLVWANTRPFAWGWNSKGQLGDSSQTQRQLPVPVTATGVLAGKTVVALAAGGVHSLALCSDGTVFAWGDNTYGQLGDNSTNSYNVPVAVNTDSGVSALSGKVVVGITAGLNHSLALCSDGTLAAWGFNRYGQLGDNTNRNRLAPVAVNTNSGSALHGRTVVAIAAGFDHNLALCGDGTVAAWGRNLDGELGNNTGGFGVQSLLPVAVSTDPNLSALSGKLVTAIAASYGHSMALCSDGTVAAWGLNTYGELGDNTLTGRLVPVAVNTDPTISALFGKTVTAIAAGGFHSLAVCSDGTVAAWGKNVTGQLGDNTTAVRQVPVAVSTASIISALSGRTALATAAGYEHSLALCSDGTVAAWGANGYGQLGDNSTTERNTPVAVNTTPLAAGERFSYVASSSAAQHTLALVAEPPVPTITLTAPHTLTNGMFQFMFSYTPGALLSVVSTTNLTLPLSNWTVLTGVTEVSPGQFKFTDSQTTSTPRRFYRVRSP
jgi:alpha-tubulin suppressor-like RCC1 family protein